MKFLVETELNETVPVEKVAWLIEKQFARREAGYGPGLEAVKVECSYGVVGRRGAVFIVEAPDAEILQQLLVFAPLFHFETMKVTPLVDLRRSLELIAESARDISEGDANG